MIEKNEALEKRRGERRRIRHQEIEEEEEVKEIECSVVKRRERGSDMRRMKA